MGGMNVPAIDAANEYFNTDDSCNGSEGMVSNNPGGLCLGADCSFGRGQDGIEKRIRF